MQIQGELKKRSLLDGGSSTIHRSLNSRATAEIPHQGGPVEVRLGMIRTAVGVVSQEGILSLWTGLSPALGRHLIYSGIRMGLYEKLRDDVLGRNPDGSFPIYKVFLTPNVDIRLYLNCNYFLELFKYFESLTRAGGIRRAPCRWIRTVHCKSNGSCEGPTSDGR